MAINRHDHDHDHDHHDHDHHDHDHHDHDHHDHDHDVGEGKEEVEFSEATDDKDALEAEYDEVGKLLLERLWGRRN